MPMTSQIYILIVALSPELYSCKLNCSEPSPQVVLNIATYIACLKQISLEPTRPTPPAIPNQDHAITIVSVPEEYF